jgi:23S rRNA (cytidine1920-2'-O)/16S rRNA (cytidine1409-2'-O)-methyltransferase
MKPKSPAKQRADLLLVEQGLVASRSKAQALILAGQVYLAEKKVNKPGDLIANDQQLTVRSTQRYVSRGGDKLEGALIDLSLSVGPWVCLDIGASTGGFTDCLLQHGASKVYAVDVGHGQLAHKLRQDQRVVVREQVNAKNLQPSDFTEALDLVVVDASFIGLNKLLPAIARVLPAGGQLLALVKPQFEAGEAEASKGRGVIRDEAVRQRVFSEVRAQLSEAGFTLVSECDCRVKGPKGNVEHFVLCMKQ